jgi:hypothetical protein
VVRARKHRRRSGAIRVGQLDTAKPAVKFGLMGTVDIATQLRVFRVKMSRINSIKMGRINCVHRLLQMDKGKF